jgi:hypothetical protein
VTTLNIQTRHSKYPIKTQIISWKVLQEDILYVSLWSRPIGAIIVDTSILHGTLECQEWDIIYITYVGDKTGEHSRSNNSIFLTKKKIKKKVSNHCYFRSAFCYYQLVTIQLKLIFRLIRWIFFIYLRKCKRSSVFWLRVTLV